MSTRRTRLGSFSVLPLSCACAFESIGCLSRTSSIYTTRAQLLARAARPADHMPMALSWHFGWIPRVMIVLLLLAPIALLFDGFILETWRDERRNDSLRSIEEKA